MVDSISAKPRKKKLLTFPWVGTFLFFLCLIFVNLGLWQLTRAEQKKQQLLDYKRNQDHSDMDFSEIQDWHATDGRKVIVHGHYLSQPQFLLDNQIQNHQVGYAVLTLFEVERKSLYLLVNRGFISKEEAKNKLALIRAKSEKRTAIRGQLTSPEKPLYLLGPFHETFAEHIHIIEGMWLDKMEKVWSLKLYPIVLLLDPQEKEGFLRLWGEKKHLYLTPDKHRSYAIQWFFLAGLIGALGIKRLLSQRKNSTTC